MANEGFFKDLSPIICPAGIVSKKTSGVQECMQIHPLDDAIEMVLHEGGLKKVDLEYERQKMQNWRHTGIFTQVRHCLNPPVPTRYQTLLNDLKETVFDTYWKQELGKVRDPIGGLPQKIDRYATTFGRPISYDVHNVKALVNPPRSHYEILREAKEYHELYKKSHNGYFPSEQKTYNYLSPPFDPNKKYGKICGGDERGIWVKCVLQDLKSEPITSANKVQAGFSRKTKFQLGKSLTPNENINCVPTGHRFGKRTQKDEYGVGELMAKDIPPSLFKKHFYEWMTHLNELRLFIKKHDVDMKQILSQCNSYDQDITGWITFQTLIEVLSGNHITFDHRCILPLADIFGYLREDGYVKYQLFLNLLNVRIAFPKLEKIVDDFDPADYYITSSQAAAKDYLKVDNSCCPAAGIPSQRLDSALPQGTIDCQSDSIHLGSESSANTLINPSIYTNYSLSQYDFWQPRSPEYLQKLFSKVGYEFPGDTFEKLYNAALKLEKTGSVSVHTFKAVLEQATPFEKKKQEVSTCDENLFKKKCNV